jgi:ABC-2 type transport system permease protein
MKRYKRSGIRMVISVVQPLVYLLTLGFGFNALFQQAGREVYPVCCSGVVAQTILFTSIFWGINIMWDKQFGFLKETLVAPVSRLKVMLGGSLGGATIAVNTGYRVIYYRLIFGFRPYSWSMLGLTLLVMGMLAVTMVSFQFRHWSCCQRHAGIHGDHHIFSCTSFLFIKLHYFLSIMCPQ